MSGDLTVERLMELASPKDPAPTSGRIPKSAYEVRKNLLDRKRDHIVAIIKANHWAKLADFVRPLSAHVSPISFLAKIRKMEINEGDRTADVLYSYMLDLYAINYYLRVIEANVENSIEYEDPVYEY